MKTMRPTIFAVVFSALALLVMSVSPALATNLPYLIRY
jgi:hypothetical protein